MDDTERKQTDAGADDADALEEREIVVNADPNDERIERVDEAVERAAW